LACDSFYGWSAIARLPNALLVDWLSMSIGVVTNRAFENQSFRLAMGVPQEQRFVRDHAGKLGRVGVIKTSL
jgi:hypothetical protein